MTTPGLAAENAERAEPGTSKKAVFFHSLEKILRACRSEAAARSGSADKMQGRRDEALVATDEKADDQLHDLETVALMRRPWRLASRNQSCSRSEKSASGALQRAMVTKTQPGAISARCSRMISRICRRRRFRVTAFPRRLPVIKPNLKSASSASLRRASTKYLPD